MLTKLDKDGRRKSEIDLDVLEIENNLNLEILEKRKEIAFKTEKRVNLVINEAEEKFEESAVFNLGNNSNIHEYDDEDEDQLMVPSRSPSIGYQTDSIMRQTVFGAAHKQGTIPYVRKRIFLKSRATFAEPPSAEEIHSLTFRRETALKSQNLVNQSVNLITQANEEDEEEKINISLQTVERTTGELSVDGKVPDINLPQEWTK